MQGLEFVDVPGLVILATGTAVMGAMVLAGIGSRRRDREAVERLHVERTEIAAPAPEIAIDVCVEPEEVSGTRAIDKNAWKCGLVEPNLDDEITGQYILTSADRDLLKRGPAIRPVPVRRKAI